MRFYYNTYISFGKDFYIHLPTNSAIIIYMMYLRKREEGGKKWSITTKPREPAAAK